MFKRVFVPTLAALFVLFGATAAKAATSREAQDFIQDLSLKAIATVAVPNISDSERSERFGRLFVSAFDIPEIGESVVGRRWRTATPAQQAEFLKAFQDTQVLTWGRRFKDYDGVKLETGAATLEGGAVWLIGSTIIPPHGDPTAMQWRVHQAANGSLRVIDIAVAGASMVLTYRDDYAAVLQSNGGNIDALVVSMRAKDKRNNPLTAAVSGTNRVGAVAPSEAPPHAAADADPRP